MQINVDAIFIVSLPEPNPRRKLIMEEISKHNIYGGISFMNAIKDENGIAGLQMSMSNVFNACMAKGYTDVLVLEDDCVFIEENPISLINKCIEQLPSDYHCLQLGTNLVTKPERYSENLLSVSYTHSTHAVIYSIKAIEIILSLFDYKTHLDSLIHKYLQPFGKCFASYPMIVNQRDGYSDIEKRTVKYGSMMKRKYEQMTKGI